MNALWHDPGAALRSMSLLLAVAALVSSLEWLTPWRHTAPYSVVAPVSDEAGVGLTPRRWSEMVRLLFLGRVVGAVVTGAGALAGSRTLTVVGLLGLAATAVLIRLPSLSLRPGMDGAEGFAAMAALAIAAGTLAGDELSMTVTVGFVALLASMEYAGAGLWKFRDFRGWHRGVNLQRVLASRYYGWEPLRRKLVSLPGPWSTLVIGSISLSVLLFESIAPLTLVLPSIAALVLIAVLLSFHITNGIVMGLNTFVWSYAVAYPAMLFLNSLLAHR